MSNKIFISISKEYCDLQQIYDSGQCFTWDKTEEGQFCIRYKNTLYYVSQTEDGLSIISDDEDTEQKMIYYFDLNTNYQEIQKLADDDKYLKTCIEKSKGLRILKQDLWETMLCFLISQNNNIPRIKKSVGKIIDLFEGFPSPEQLQTVEQLKECGLGYRDKYLIAAARQFPSVQNQLETGSYEENRKTLMTFLGIGPKVADCICLFALHHIDAFPIDTHIKKIMASEYPEGLPEKYKSYAGILQQYMFYNDLRR